VPTNRKKRVKIQKRLMHALHSLPSKTVLQIPQHFDFRGYDPKKFNMMSKRKLKILWYRPFDYLIKN
jgi:hypothetical protein